MTDTTYRTAGLQASAAASRARSIAACRTADDASSWSAAASLAVATPGAPQVIKPATQMFVDASDHRRRRLSEPSP